MSNSLRFTLIKDCAKLNALTGIVLTVLFCLSGTSWAREHHSETSFHPEIRHLVAHVSWTRRDGAPGDIAALAQTSDGYLWIGSSVGLYRFDGIQFASYPATSLDTPLPSWDISGLAADSKDGLWIGFHLGGITYLARDGKVTTYNRQNGRGPGAVQKLLCRSNGSVWAIGDGKLLVLRNQRWENFGAQHGLPDNELFTLYFDRAGNLWTSARHRLYVLRSGHSAFEIYPTKVFAVVDFAEMPNGQLWISDAWRSVRPLLSQSPSAVIPTESLGRIVIEPSGTIWIAQDYRGLFHGPALQPNAIVQEPDITSEQAEAILRDRDGNIWVGTSRGLDRFQPTPLQTLTHIRVEYYSSVAAYPRGGLWIATMAHPLLYVSGRVLTPLGHEVGSSPIVCDQQGHVWLVDPTTHALMRYNRGGVFETKTPKEVHNMVAQSIGLDRDGAILVAFLTQGLWRYNGEWERVENANLPQDDALAIVRDSEDRVWLGFPDSRIILHDAAGYHTFSKDQSANLGNTLTFAMASGKLWAGGANGLAYFNRGAFHRVQLSSENVLRGVSGIAQDKAGNLWLNASGGIFRIAAAEVQKALAGSRHPLNYDLLDEKQGILGSATQLKPTPSAIVEKDGTLWFSTGGHVFSLDPATFTERRPLPDVKLEDVIVNGVTVLDREHRSRRITMDAGSLGGLEIDYIGLDLTSPEKITYRYTLVGEDNGWQNAGIRRQAFYNHLSPGNYRFRVIATDGSEVSELRAPLALTVTPTFYQTTWFYVLCILIILGLLYFIYMLRVQYVTTRLRERMRERSSERLRIARELHDTLLQSVHGLMLRFHFATEALPEDEPARQSLQIALARADEVIVEGRRRVQELREEMPDSVDFAAQIATIASELQMDQGINFQVVENGERHELLPNVQTELCRIAHEALLNTLEHSGATTAEVVLIYGSWDFVMKCCDNGVGLAPSILANGKRDGHWGLVGMRERALTIDGSLRLWSSPGNGMEIEVRISGRRAYRFPPKRLLWLNRLHQLRHDSAGNRVSD